MTRETGVRRRVRARWLLAAAAAAALVLAACRGGGGDGLETPAATPVGDEEYLAVICAGLDRFTDALMVAQTPDEVRAVVEEYIADLELVTPPEDVRPFHEAFIQYLRDAVDEPLALLTTPPPTPEEEVRQRLAEKERSVAECRNPTFFQREE